MLDFAKFNEFYGIFRNKLMEVAKECDCGCFPVSKIAARLKMYQRMVRAHQKIIEINNAIAAEQEG